MNNYDVKKEQVSKKIERWFFLGIVFGGILGIFGFLIFDNTLFIFSAFLFGTMGAIYGFIEDRKEKIKKNKKIFSNK